jgi:hypothetical protein
VPNALGSCLARNRRSPKRPSEPRPSGAHPEEDKVGKDGIAFRIIGGWGCCLLGGKKVRFTRELRESRGSATGSLLKPPREYFVDRPEDEFQVEFGGERMTVQRKDTEEAERFESA